MRRKTGALFKRVSYTVPSPPTRNISERGLRPTSANRDSPASLRTGASAASRFSFPRTTADFEATVSPCSEASTMC